MDGGYGYVIIFASMMCNLVVDGVIYAYSVMKIPLREYFNVGEAMIILPGSVAVGVYMLCGPLYSQLVSRYGCRIVIIIGSIISCVAMSLSIFCSNIYAFVVIYGIFGGFGFGMIYLPSIIVLSSYFDKKLTIATGIVVSGSGIGVLSFGLLAGVLFDEYGWKGGMLLLSGIILNCAVFGTLMKPFLDCKYKSDMKVKKSSSIKEIPAETETYKTRFNKLLSNNVIFDPIVGCLCLANVFGFLSFLLVMMLLVTVAEKQLRFSRLQSRFTMTILGITNTIGRFLFAWIANPKCLSISYINWITLAISAVACLVFIWLKSYGQLICFAVVFGFFTAPYIGLTPAVIRETVGNKLYSRVLGVTFFFRGLISIVGPSLGGYMSDVTGSYNSVFILAACSFGACALLHFLIPFLYRLSSGIVVVSRDEIL